MQKRLLTKLFSVVILTILIGIPLMMIHSTIAERITYHSQAVQSIAADSVYEQGLIGPILVIPYTDEYEEDQILDAKTQKKVLVKRSVNRRKLVFPNTLRVEGDVNTDNRYRGIHKVPFYSGRFSVSGDFVMPALESLHREKSSSKIVLSQPFVTLAINDVRGIRNIPRIKWEDKNIEFQQGTGLQSISTGLHALVAIPDQKHEPSVKFSFKLNLDGTERLRLSPVAKDNLVTLRSEWAHPQFGGRFLPSPKDRSISNAGFTATWEISALSTNAQRQILSMEGTGNPTSEGQRVGHALAAGHVDSFGVGFIEPVNIYSQAERAVKYGLLFVALTFAAFFLFEVLKQLPIHPIQYLLVGIALSLFFLLLVSLSEHISFEMAYLIASSACILLIGFYLSYVLRDWKRGFGFATGLTILYGVLFGLLRSEDNALVMGSALLFGLLSIVMIATRNIDWYKLGVPNEENGK